MQIDPPVLPDGLAPAGARAVPPARRIVSVWFPHFPIEHHRRQAERLGNPMPEDIPFALSTPGPHGPVIHALNRAAALAGVTTGARVVDMRALCPNIQVDYADPGRDRAALDRLALWARRWCPWTAVDVTGGDHALILDTTGTAHLHGGEAAMLREIEADLSRLGLTARLALAPTWGAAWALARFGPVRAIQSTPADLHPLPVAALRLGADTRDLLNRLGLRTIGALAALPRLSLARRFSRAALADNPLLRLDQVTGHQPEPVSPPDAPPVFRADLRLPEPIFDPTHHLPGLATALCAQLATAGQGARRVRLSVFRSDGEVSRIEAATAEPSRDAAHLAWLFRDRLEKIDPGFGFDLVSLEAVVAEPLHIPQRDLGGESDDTLDLGQLIDRLAVRFGARAITRPAPAASHVPERAEVRQGANVAPQHVENRTERPVSLLIPPEEISVVYPMPEGPPAQFLWRRQTHRVTRYQGPERIAPEWWQDKPGTRLRDYFKVEDEAGARFWVYREGAFHDGRGGAPRWFLHGMFA